MDTLEAIYTRRSIRKYTDHPVADELIEQIIRAGMMAPSARNEQAWQFIVVRRPETLQALSQVSPFAGMVRSAQATIIVCGDRQLETVPNLNYWALDCCNATQNILLAAHALGLGCVWVALYPREERIAAFRQVLPLPDHIVPLCMVPLGYPAETKEKVDRFEKTRIHNEQW